MVTAYSYRRGRRVSRKEDTRLAGLEDQMRRLWVAMALVGPGLALLADAHPLALLWWLVAGPTFSTVLLVSVGLLTLIVMHQGEAPDDASYNVSDVWKVSGLLLIASLSIPLGFLALSHGADWDPKASLAVAMCAAYVLAVFAERLTVTADNPGVT